MKKRERYFQDELRKLFMTYATIPALFFTLICGIIIMAALLVGKYSIIRNQNQWIIAEMQRVVESCGSGLKKLSDLPGILSEHQPSDGKRDVFELVYQIQDEVGYKADFYVLNADGEILLRSESSDAKTQQDYTPEYLGQSGDVSWGFLASLQEQPGQVVVELRDGWKSQGSSIVIGTAVDTIKSMENDGSAAAGQTADNVTRGSLVFAVNCRQMQQLMNQADIQIIVSDSYGWVFLGNSSLLLTESNQVREELRNAGAILAEDGHVYLICKGMAADDRFEVYSVVDIQNIFASLGISVFLIVMAFLVMSLWLVVVSKKVTEKKTEDFYKILDVLEQVKGGDLNCEISIESENEFQIIADACNEMMHGLKQQMENNQKMAMLVAAAQNKQLESQFNPHFLYNTLENIRYMCRLEPGTADRMIYNLSGLLRYSLNHAEAEVPLREDLEHLENYLSILKYRFGERFLCQRDIAPEVMDCQIPKLVFQPMIENAVKYGFGKQEYLTLELKAYEEDGNLIMICRDDGVGMSSDTLRELRELLQKEENVSRHSGLYNIHRRITILYGQPYGVAIQSEENKGTELIVTLPVKKEG